MRLVEQRLLAVHDRPSASAPHEWQSWWSRPYEYGEVCRQLDRLGIVPTLHNTACGPWRSDMAAWGEHVALYAAFWDELRKRCDHLTLSDVFPVSPGAPEEYEQWDLNTPWVGLAYGVTFDVAICISTLEHLDDPTTAMKHLLEHLNPGGHLFVTQDVPAPPVEWVLTGLSSVWPQPEYGGTAVLFSHWVIE